MMKRFILAAGVAALAIAAPATAERGGKGGGHDSHAAKAERGGGSKAKAQKAERRSAARVERRSAARAERRAERPVRFANFERKAERRNDRAIEKREKAVVKQERKALERRADRIDRRADRIERRADRIDRREALRDRDVLRIRDFDNDRFDRRIAARTLNDWCPPGLEKKRPRCMPPGQAQKLVGQRLPSVYASSLLPDRLRSLYRDDDDYYYRYGDGYLYRVDRKTQLVNSLLPLFGASLGLGQLFPTTYANAYVPSYYQPFYRDDADDYYRYANGYVYEIDRSSGLIEDIVPLMAGGYGVGQLLPAGYSAYNVPYQYRDYYHDTDDYYYRYAPGAIYQVDPQTQLITSVASLLSPTGFAVGQPLPMGYSAYNVPYGYRDQYYDTADNWYRYNNGSIYQVDPTTQLITAIIRAIV